MGNLTFEESNNWRVSLKNELLDIGRNLGIKINAINPNDYFNFLHKSHESEKEVRNFDLRLVKKSDFIIVNFNDPNSIGTSQELAIANEYSIPVIGLNAEKYNIHPWLIECCERIFYQMDTLIEYIKDFYIL